MYRVEGYAVSNGIAIGKARVVKDKELIIPDFLIDISEVENCLLHFQNSLCAVIDDIDEFIKHFELTEEDKNIIETHKMILLDPELHNSIKSLIKDDKMNLELAVYTHFTRTISYFRNLENELYADRAVDYDDVYKRLIFHIKKINNHILTDVSAGNIVIMEDVPPSLVSQLQKLGVIGIALQKGTKTSHSVIIARALGLPILTKIKHAHKIHNDDIIILDAKKGVIIGNPTKEVLKEYQELKEKIHLENDDLKGFIDLSAKTADCEIIKLLSNIELPIEIEQILRLKTDGIGLFRTEFFYLNRQNLPSEDEQYQEYRLIAQKLGQNPFTIRTIDIGGDKVANIYTKVQEANPNLGCRGIRYSLRYKNIFKTQLRAILRASVFGNVQIMFPMIASIEEFLEAKSVVEECKKELKAEKKAFDESISVGTMIEIPSAALYADVLAEHSDFFSIGTNDLLQYVVAVDRNNEHVAKYYNPFTPAFLLLIHKTIQSATKYNKPVSICGELANDKHFTAFLLCLGVRELSVGLEHTLDLKKHIRSINIQKGLPFLDEFSKCNTIKDTELFIKRMNSLCLYERDFIAVL